MVTDQKKKKNEISDRNIKPHNFKVNDRVIIRLGKSPLYEKAIYTVVKVKGNAIYARSDEGHEVLRNAERVKHYVPPTSTEQKTNTPPATEPRSTRSRGKAPEHPWVMPSTRKKN